MIEPKTHIVSDKELSRKLTIHTNLDEDVIITTTDKLELRLRDHQKSLIAKQRWYLPLSILITLVITLATASFKPFWGFKAEHIEAFFYTGVISCLYLLIKSLIILWCNRKKGIIKTVIEELKNKTKEDALSREIYSKRMDSWVAINKPQNSQGGDYKEIPLDKKPLKQLVFKAKSSSLYWRAGIKLESPNATKKMPLLTTKDSFLFHIGLTDGEYEFAIYNDGDFNSRIVKNISGIISKHRNIVLKIERDSTNDTKCFINDELVYHKDLAPDLFKKVYLAAWGDKKDYEVSFDDIVFNRLTD